MSLIKSHSRSTNMSQQLCALTLMALILGYGTFAAPQLVMRPVNQLHGYSDADWAGQTDDRRSTSGYVFFVAGGPVSWQSKTQKSVALSTAEAEYSRPESQSASPHCIS